MLMRSVVVFIIIFMVSGCATKPKMMYVHNHDPIIDQNDGVVLLIDVCNQVDVVGKSDYCIINESMETASSIVEPFKTYLEQNGVFVRTEMVPFVCGAFDTPDNLVLVAEKEGETVNEASKPFAISDDFQKDPEYLNSLTTLSTYITERVIVKTLEDSGKIEKPIFMVHEDQFKEAVTIIKARTNATSLVYIGIKGKKISGGKKFGQGLLAVTSAVATGVATFGMGGGYVVAIWPRGNEDWRFSIAGLVNMETEELNWSSYTSTGKNPITKDKALEVSDITRYYQIDSLLKDLVYTPEQTEGAEVNN